VERRPDDTGVVTGKHVWCHPPRRRTAHPASTVGSVMPHRAGRSDLPIPSRGRSAADTRSARSTRFIAPPAAALTAMTFVRFGPIADPSSPCRPVLAYRSQRKCGQPGWPTHWRGI